MSKLSFFLSSACLLMAACSSDPNGATSETLADGGRPREAGRDAGKDAKKGDQDEGKEEVVVDENGCGAIRKSAPESKGQVDVVWLIDTSASMIDELEKVQKNIATFMSSLETTNADTHAVMITGLDPAGGTPLAGDDTRYRFLQAEVDSTFLYTVALTRFRDYASFLRPNAATHFVMVSDDNDFVPPAAFRAQMEENLGHAFTVHAIASESVNGRPCANPICGGIPIPAVCGAAAVGTAYNTLAEDTGGEQISICTEDWTSVFDELRSAVVAAAPLPCDYDVATLSSGNWNPDEVQVVFGADSKDEKEFPKAKTRDACADKLGWHYDDESKPGTVVLCPAACSAVRGGGTIDIAFGCKPLVLI